MRPDDQEAEEESTVYYGTYIDKDTSDKPDGVKKMLKVTVS
jgi:hypothetical protein